MVVPGLPNTTLVVLIDTDRHSDNAGGSIYVTAEDGYFMEGQVTVLRTDENGERYGKRFDDRSDVLAIQEDSVMILIQTLRVIVGGMGTPITNSFAIAEEVGVFGIVIDVVTTVTRC